MQILTPMQTVVIEKEILSGALNGSVVEDRYISNIKDRRVVGQTYQGYSHKYRVRSIKYRHIQAMDNL
jgi:hypothetical protein